MINLEPRTVALSWMPDEEVKEGQEVEATGHLGFIAFVIPV